MSSIVGTLALNHDGVKQLRRHGLMGSTMEDNGPDPYDSVNEDGFRTYTVRYFDVEDEDDSDSDVWMLDGDDTAGAQPWNGRRPQEGTAEDQALRRRRREAMVFSEGGQPLGRENIIEPIRQDSLDEDVEDPESFQDEESRDSVAFQQQRENDDVPRQEHRRSWLPAFF